MLVHVAPHLTMIPLAPIYPEFQYVAQESSLIASMPPGGAINISRIPTVTYVNHEGALSLNKLTIGLTSAWKGRGR